MARALRLEDGLYFVDLPSLVVGRFELAAGVGAGWVPFEYELEDFAGVGLATGALSSAGELILDLGLSGWHMLHFCHTPLLDVWLDGERGYRSLLGPQESDGVQDFALHAADLAGRRLHIAPRRGVNPREVVLFYVRAVACEGAPKGARNLVGTNDGHDIFLEGLEAARDIYRFFYLFRDSDFFRMLWGNYGGGLVRPEPGTDLADMIPWEATHDFYAYERVFAESLRKIHHGGEDVLATAVAAAREVGMEIHFYFRVGAFYSPFPHYGKTSRFYLDHPELRCRDEFGREVKRISYAFPELQERVLRYFEWLLQYEPDGLCLTFNRGLPMMVFEEPVLDEFRRRHGRPPRLPEEADGEPMRLVRQELLAGFVGRVNRLVSERGKVLSCICPRNFDENRRRGLDLEMLVERGACGIRHGGRGARGHPRLHRPQQPAARGLRGPGAAREAQEARPG